MISHAQAAHFADEWITAWNSHDLTRILSHYRDDFVMASPRIASIAGVASGVLEGRDAVGAYWAKALAMMPDLHFTLIACFVGADSVALHYEGVRGPAMEVMFFDEAGLVIRAAAHYL